MNRTPLSPIAVETAIEQLFSSDIAFTPVVKNLQTLKGSRRAYARMEEGGSWSTTITPGLKSFIEAQESVFLATANAAGQPYIQHRGGPAGFLRVLDERTIGFADFAGNRQFITLGNLVENPKAHLFLIDYESRRRIKIWGTMKAVEDDPELVGRLMPAGYNARAGRALLLKVSAWDENCPQHIPVRVGVSALEAAFASRDQRIAALTAEVERLRRPLES